jgi:hypothetical protein
MNQKGGHAYSYLSRGLANLFVVDLDVVAKGLEGWNDHPVSHSVQIYAQSRNLTITVTGSGKALAIM